MDKRINLLVFRRIDGAQCEGLFISRLLTFRDIPKIFFLFLRGCCFTKFCEVIRDISYIPWPSPERSSFTWSLYALKLWSDDIIVIGWCHSWHLDCIHYWQTARKSKSFTPPLTIPWSSLDNFMPHCIAFRPLLKAGFSLIFDRFKLDSN